MPGALATVELRHLDELDPSSPPTFTVQFRPVVARWAYYVVVRTPLPSTQEPTFGSRARAPCRFGTTNGTRRIPLREARDRVGAKLVASYPQHRVMRLLSDQVVPAREFQPSLRLFLGDDRVMTLPSPAPARFSAVQLAETSPRYPTHYHIVHL